MADSVKQHLDVQVGLTAPKQMPDLYRQDPCSTQTPRNCSEGWLLLTEVQNSRLWTQSQIHKCCVTQLSSVLQHDTLQGRSIERLLWADQTRPACIYPTRAVERAVVLLLVLVVIVVLVVLIAVQFCYSCSHPTRALTGTTYLAKPPTLL